MKEYEFDQIEKRANGNGGIWRIPPSFDGSIRQPLPRFTALNERERRQLYRFFAEWAKVATRALLPGGHVILACNSFLAQLVYAALVEGGLEFRGQIIRVVRTLRGGDRPKNAEGSFPASARSLAAPMSLGAFPEAIASWHDSWPVSPSVWHRRFSSFAGRIPSPLSSISGGPKGRTRDCASSKPEASGASTQTVWSILPLGEGVVCDPFMGSGSTWPRLKPSVTEA